MQQTSVLMESDSQRYEKDWYVTPKHGHQLRIKWHKSIPIYRKARNQAVKDSCTTLKPGKNDESSS